MQLATELYTNIIKYLRSDESMRLAQTCRLCLGESKIYANLFEHVKKSTSLVEKCKRSQRIQTFYTNINHSIRTMTPVCSISTGHNYTIISSHNNVYVKGENQHYQLGLNDRKYRREFTQLVTAKKVKKFTVGLHHTLFLFEDESVSGCGWNKFNQLNMKNKSHNQKLKPIKNIQCIDIQAAQHFSIFLLSDGSLRGSGKSKAHCIKRSVKKHRNKGVGENLAPSKLNKIQAISVNKQCVIAMDINGKVFGWGKLSQNRKKITLEPHLLDTIKS